MGKAGALAGTVLVGNATLPEKTVSETSEAEGKTEMTLVPAASEAEGKAEMTLVPAASEAEGKTEMTLVPAASDAEGRIEITVAEAALPLASDIISVAGSCNEVMKPTGERRR